MVKYNELRISGDYLIYDIEVEDLPYYKELGINGIRIDIPYFYKMGQPYTFSSTPELSEKRWKGKLLISAITKDLIKVTPLIAPWVPPSDIPCGKDEINPAIVYDENIIFDKALPYIKELNMSCNIPKGFIDHILRHRALDLFIKTCNYDEAIKYWEMFNYTTSTDVRGCGCSK